MLETVIGEPSDNIENDGVETRPEWATIPGFTGYEISDSGQVRNAKGHILKQRFAHNGAKLVDLGKSSKLVHKLLLRAFTGHATTKGFYPKHLNLDKADNRLENLAWAGKPR